MSRQESGTKFQDFNSVNDQNSNWSTGWYLYEDGKVVGPLDADDTFSRSVKTSAGQLRMVSRKGFSQWYPLTDFAELHHLASKYAGQSTQDLGANQSPMKRFEPVSKVVGPAVEVSSVAATAAVEITEPQKTLSRKEKKKLLREEKKNAASAKAAVQEVEKKPIPSNFDDQYLLLASRLRLGKIRSGLMAGFVLGPVTLFGYWAAWLLRAGEEVTWHLTGSAKVRFGLPIWMSLIPGIHLIFAIWLAKLVIEMEKQNGYKSMSMFGAGIAAICPPLFMWKLQNALNRHWRLHVKHAVSNR